MFSIYLPVAVSALHTNTRIIQTASSNATIVLTCTDLYAKKRLLRDTHLSADTSFCSTNSSTTADNRTRINTILLTTNDLRNNLLMGISRYIAYFTGK
jgi:hypothetical protein